MSAESSLRYVCVRPGAAVVAAEYSVCMSESSSSRTGVIGVSSSLAEWLVASSTGFGAAVSWFGFAADPYPESVSTNGRLMSPERGKFSGCFLSGVMGRAAGNDGLSSSASYDGHS